MRPEDLTNNTEVEVHINNRIYRLYYVGEKDTMIEETRGVELHRVKPNQYNLYSRKDDEIISIVTFDKNNKMTIENSIDMFWLETIIKDRKKQEYELSLRKVLGI